MRFIPCTILLLLIGTFVIAQPGADARAGAAVKLHDRNGDGRIEWSEVQQTRADYAARLAKVGAAKDPEAARKQVESDYKPLLELMDFLLADANRDLVVTAAELRTFLEMSDKDKRPQPELWHHEQLTKLWVGAHWDELLDQMDDDGDDLISFMELALNYPADTDINYLKAADRNKDNKLDRSEYATFKAKEHLAGLYVEELDQSVGVAGGADAATEDTEGNPSHKTRAADDSHKTEATNDRCKLKLGSSWQRRYNREESTSYEWNRLIYLDGKWLKGVPACMKDDIKRFRFRVECASSHSDTPEHWNETGRMPDWSAGKDFRYPRDDAKLTTVRTKAGKFECLRRTTYDPPESKGKSRKVKSVQYFIECSGIPILVKEVTPDGRVLMELTKFNP